MQKKLEHFNTKALMPVQKVKAFTLQRDALTLTKVALLSFDAVDTEFSHEYQTIAKVKS
jgi:hypothetical protein